MTDTSITASTSTSPDPAATAPLTPSVAKVLAALYRLGEATAAQSAAEAGLGYSTTTPKLRTLQRRGLAEAVHGDDGRTLWRLTDTGRIDAKQAVDPGPGAAQPAAGPTCAAAADTATARTAQVEHFDTDGAPEQPDDASTQTPVPGADGDPAPTTAPPAPADTHEPQDRTAGDEPSAEPGRADADDPPAPAPDGTTQGAGVEGAPPAAAPAAPAARCAAQPGDRRASGTLRGAVLDILEAHPAGRFKVGELCKLIDEANTGSGAKKASAGAVHNAATKLVAAGRAVLAAEKPVTFALADTSTVATT